MRKQKIETHYVVTYLSREDGIKMSRLLKEDGPVSAIDCAGVVAIVANESQLKKLTKAGVKWKHISNSDKTEGRDEKETRRGTSKTVRTATHRR
jgi:hypothetical protein